jgi:transcriptional regulator GlxA family with amidase domain
MLFAGAVQAIRANRPALQQLLAGTTANILGLLYSAQQAVATGNQGGQTAIENAIARLEEDLERKIDIHALMRELGVSYSWFRNTFTRHTGLSPHQYRLHLRLDRARNLLTQTRLSVKEVAAKAGFDDEHYFSRLFRRKIGFTPSEWRARSQRAR